ncbi:MAG: hypothetical protein HFE57_03510 [Firmicutes bacterium]|jgi:hypothetical protein|nr:hypothetical protein [Bacillota bacterium]
MIKKNIENDMALENLDNTEYDEIISIPREFVKLQKAKLQEKQEAVRMISDDKKLDEVIKVINGVSQLGDILTDENVINKVRNNISTAKDLNFLADTYIKMLNALDTVKRCDTIDAEGTPKRLALAIGFQGVKVGVQIENN